MAEYVRPFLPGRGQVRPVEQVVPLATLEELLGRRLAPHEGRVLEVYGLKLYAPCVCDPLPTGSLLEKLVCRNGHALFPRG